MTKDEMLARSTFQQDNYKRCQDIIQDAMNSGEKYVFIPKDYPCFSWYATNKTIERLKEDGFIIDKMFEPDEYHSVEWGFDDDDYKNKEDEYNNEYDWYC